MPGRTQVTGRIGLGLFVVYAVALLASHVVARSRPQSSPLRSEDRVVTLPGVATDTSLAQPTRVVYRDTDPTAARGLPVVVLVHGSPGGLRDFNAVAGKMRDRVRVVSLDLPGFGRSQHDVPDYSFAAHARYVLQLLDHLQVEAAHWVGFSLGGGVALTAAEIAPARVTSISLVGAIGVQELELLGQHDLNQAIHGLQLGLIWAMENLIPHFGALEDFALGSEYARNFYDSDQRPLRGILEGLQMPVLVMHGREDPLVPYAAALEHHRIVPHSEFVTLEGGHFMLWERPAEVADQLAAFVQSVVSGDAVTGEEAPLARLSAAAAPYEAQEPARGIGLVVLVLLIVVGTFVTEDLTCIGTGLLIAAGRLEFTTGLLACFAGIFVGDQLLYLAGRLLGPAVLERGPVHWFIRPARIQSAARWFDRRGMAVIFLSRFVPGTRLPTYVAAGMVRAGYWRFVSYFLIAVALWAPLLVGLSVVVGRSAVDHLDVVRHWSGIGVAALVVALLLVVQVGVPLLTHRGRRRLVAGWRRTTRWEFWPWGVFYLPMVPIVAGLALRHRMLAGLTAVNPGIESGGLVGESKFDILQGLTRARNVVAAAALIGADDEAREAAVRAFLDAHELDLPVVLKPDVGERGQGVTIARTWDAVRARVAPREDLLVQEYVPGVEFGVFYVRHPSAERGQVFSITEKLLPEVIGDGERTLEWLILDDPRAVIQAEAYMQANLDRLQSVPAKGERVRLVEIGTHCRGAVFGDGWDRRTPDLEEAIDRVSQTFEGFYFGRYDVRAASAEEFSAGRFRILELNGLTSEATHIYAPGTRLTHAYGVLTRQWAHAFEIAAENRRRGLRGDSWREILTRLVEARHRS